MTSYLIQRGAFPFTAEEVRNAIGLQTSALDLVIAGGIASICLMSTKPVTPEAWFITVDQAPDHYGKPSSVGEPQIIAGDARPARRVEYAPDPAVVAQCRARAERWARNQHDIALALMAEQGAPVELAQVA